VANIFVSYTSSDRDWAFWIGHQLESLGHVPHIHDWEISGGGNVMSWMQEKHGAADRFLCVVSNAYLKMPYSTLERQAAEWVAISKKNNFILPVFVEACEAPTLFAPLKRCELFGLNENDAQASLEAFLTPAAKPKPGVFPGVQSLLVLPSKSKNVFPGKAALSNIPMRVPMHFVGRDDVLAEMNSALCKGGGALLALYGLRGVGKTTLCAAYAERYRDEYQVIWWIRAQTELTMRLDIVSLGTRLGWLSESQREEAEIEIVMERFRHEGEQCLLIFDNAHDVNSIRSYLPRGSRAKVLITSNSHAWRDIAVPVEIKVWPKEQGADYLIARTGRMRDRSAAETLSEKLGGLPLAHEQAAAYCEHLDVDFTNYLERFSKESIPRLDDADFASADYRNGLTVAKTFQLAIDEAEKIAPLAKTFICCAALLGPDPIPIILFSKPWKQYPAVFRRTLAVGDAIDRIIAALRKFSLVDREELYTHHDAVFKTPAIRLHPLVRIVAAERLDVKLRASLQLSLVAAIASVYPKDCFHNPRSWPRCAQLTPHLMSLRQASSDSMNSTWADLLTRAGSYFRLRASYAQAKPLLESALAIREKTCGPEHRDTATSLNELASLIQHQGNLSEALPLYQRALRIRETVLGSDHPDTATSLHGLAGLLRQQGELAASKSLYGRALSIRERVRGAAHRETGTSLNELASLLRQQGDLAAAHQLLERALEIREHTHGLAHPRTATTLNSLAGLRRQLGDLDGARPLLMRALEIRESALGAEHPDTATSLNELASLLRQQGDLEAARPLLERALKIREKAYGPHHFRTATSINNLGSLMRQQGEFAGAKPLLERALEIRQTTLGSAHPDTATTLNELAALMRHQGDLTGARRFLERALAIRGNSLGAVHPHTATSLNNLARLLEQQGDLSGASTLFERALEIREQSLGPTHPSTSRVRDNLLRLFRRSGNNVQEDPKASPDAEGGKAAAPSPNRGIFSKIVRFLARRR
jgi:tetratricopeptide (TPR) repeat protein